MGAGVVSDSFGVDWLSFTVPDWSHRDVSFLDDLGLPSSYSIRDKGFMGWRCSAFPIPGLVYAWGGQSDTFHVSVSGGALRSIWMSQHPDWSFPDFCHFLVKSVVAFGFRVVRLDLFLDDVDYLGFGLLDIDSVARAVRSRSYSCVSSKWSVIESDSGTTVSIGSRASERYLRIYDKAAEVVANHDFEVSEVPEHWLRVELECKGDYAHRTALYISNWAFVTRSSVASVVGGFVRFVDCYDEVHVEREQTSEWWEDFLAADSCKVPSVYSSVEKSIQRSVEFLLKISRVLARVVIACGNDAISDILSDGLTRLDASDYQLIELYLDALGVREAVQI